MTDTDGKDEEGIDLLYKLNFSPEFIGAARGNLFLLGLEERSHFCLKVDSEDVKLNIFHYRGANIEGKKHRVFLPIRFIPAFHKLPSALATIGADDPLHQNTILHTAIQNTDADDRFWLQHFLKSFDVHPSIRLAEVLGKLFAERCGFPFKPYRGNDHVARSKIYNDVLMIDGKFYAEFCELELKSAIEVFVRAAHEVKKIESPPKKPETHDTGLKENFFRSVGFTRQSSITIASNVIKPTDFAFWRSLFTRQSPKNTHAFEEKILLPDYSIKEGKTPVVDLESNLT